MKVPGSKMALGKGVLGSSHKNAKKNFNKSSAGSVFWDLIYGIVQWNSTKFVKMVALGFKIALWGSLGLQN